MLLRLYVEFVGGSDAYPQMISIPLLKSKVGGNFATTAISGLQLQRNLSEETAKVHKLQEKVVKHEKAFQVKPLELTWHIPNSCSFSLHLRWKGKSKTQQSRASGCCSKNYERPVLIHTHSWKLAAVKVQVEGKKRNSAIEGQRVLLKKLQKARVNSHTFMETCYRSFTDKIQDIGMQVGGRARESPETGDPVRATKTVCCTIRISLNYRGHGDPLKNYQYS